MEADLCAIVLGMTLAPLLRASLAVSSALYEYVFVPLPAHHSHCNPACYLENVPEIAFEAGSANLGRVAWPDC